MQSDNYILFFPLYAVKAQTSLAPLSRFRGSRVTTAHAHQCCIFQSYAKTVPSRIKLTMKLTMREPTFMGSMTTDTWSRRVTSDFNSVLVQFACRDSKNIFFSINLQYLCWRRYDQLKVCSANHQGGVQLERLLPHPLCITWLNWSIVIKKGRVMETTILADGFRNNCKFTQVHKIGCVLQGRRSIFGIGGGGAKVRKISKKNWHALRAKSQC